MPLIITPVVHKDDDYGLTKEALELLWRMEEGHFWHHARNRWIEAALRRAGVLPPAKILEVGCGSGAVSTFLHAAGYEVTGIDTGEAQVRKAHERCAGATFIVGDVAEIDGASGPYDAICFFDVLEHLDDPLALLNAARRLSRPGTLFAATVPALRSLHTVIDDLSGHKKRYERGELTELFARAGLTAIEERGIFRYTLPMQRLSRRGMRPRDVAALSDSEKQSLWAANFRVPAAPINLALRALCAIERAGFDGARGRDGASLLAVGRAEA